MLMLLVTVILGVVFAIFATQNNGTTTIYFGNFPMQSIPLYLVVLIPLLLGLSISFVIHLVKTWSDSMTISEDKDEIKALKEELAEVTKEAHKLELENTKFKAKTGEFDEDSI